MSDSTNEGQQAKEKRRIEVHWKGQILQVVRQLHQGERSIVYVVRDHSGNERVLKVFVSINSTTIGQKAENCTIEALPSRFKRDWSKLAYKNEARAYKLLKSASCHAVPCFYGSSLSTTFDYPPNCRIPEEYRLRGAQRTILLQYLDGDPITPENFTEEIGQKALQSLKLIHQLSICHRDLNSFLWARNFMVMRDGTVKFIDFEYSSLESTEAQVEYEWKLAVRILGSRGTMMGFTEETDC